MIHDSNSGIVGKGDGWTEGSEGPLDVAVLFIDVVKSTDFAGVMDLKEYSDFVGGFRRLCLRQVDFYFNAFKRKKYRKGRDYSTEQIGDELVVFMHSGNSPNDVYQLLCLSLTLKCGWVASEANKKRVQAGFACTELAVGIHFGRVWARWSHDHFETCGFAINVAKRIESLSRLGTRFRIYLTDSALKQVNRRVRNVIFGRRSVSEMQGITVSIAATEVLDTFINCARRLCPEYGESFLETSLLAIQTTSYDLWIHSCYQVWSESLSDSVSNENMDLCQYTLNLDPRNAVALYYLGQGLAERNDLESAAIIYRRLTNVTPGFPDGWLERGRIAKLLNHTEEANESLRCARLLGVLDSEEELLTQ